ncbi:MAG: HNH endonuclease [Roseiflexus sp.]|nr:HNH endonuclease [Roseiflexus sp.]
MNSLPHSNQLSISALAASFDKVTNSYKFYWFLAILDHIKESQTRTIPVATLLAHMVARVWFPTNYFRLSFGKQDQLSNIATLLRESSGLPIDSSYSQVFDEALKHMRDKDDIGKVIYKLARFVPYRFLRPFFSKDLRGVKDTEINRRISELSQLTFDCSPCLYRFIETEQAIEIHPKWFEYLKRHLAILRGFCLWNLIEYLQRHNPNIPNIPSKLFEPQERDLRNARKFWDIVFKNKKSLQCIYSGATLDEKRYSLDHFIPWSFTANDCIWNIVPTTKEINSSKSDSIPKIDRYFDVFAQIQFDAVRIVSEEKPKLLEDHVLLFKVDSASELRNMDPKDFSRHLRDTIIPQVQIARNMGFPTDWEYHR